MTLSIKDITALIKRRKALIRAFVLKYRNEPFIAFLDKPIGDVTHLYIHPNVSANRWRITAFDRSETPMGHAEFKTYQDAVRAVVMEYKVDLTKESSGRFISRGI